MGVSPDIHLAIDTLVLADGLVPHPEAFRQALVAHLTRLLAEQKLAPGRELQLESASLELPPGLDTESAAAHIATQLHARLTGGHP